MRTLPQALEWAWQGQPAYRFNLVSTAGLLTSCPLTAARE